MREDFERWYLQVVKGHPNNLTKDEDGGYKYLAAMYMGWEAATMIEREACAKVARRWGETHEAHVTVNARNAGRKIADGIMLRSNEQGERPPR